MKKIVLIPFVFLFACNENNTSGTVKETTVIEPATVSQTRTNVKASAAASYSEPIKDELNNWKFAVALYETERTFHYTVRVQCKEIRVTDSVNIPDFGTMPRVEIRKGNRPLSCIIGFLDKENIFQEYREVSFMDDRLRMKTLHTYAVTRTVKK